MSDIYLNPSTGDVLVENGEIRLCETLQEITPQKVYITLSVNKGSWKFNIDFGPAWLKNANNNVQLLGGKPKGIVDAAIKQAILSVDGVLGVTSFESTVDNNTRALNVNFTFLTAEGEISSNATVNI